MPDFVEDIAAAGAESRWWRRLGRSFISADSYGLVLLLVVVTYAVSVSVTQAWAGSIVLTVALVTVWFTLRTAHAHPLARLLANIVLALAAIAAIVSFFVHSTGDQRGGIFVVCCLLYLIAPFSIIRHLVLRPEIDTETLSMSTAACPLRPAIFSALCLRFPSSQHPPTRPFHGGTCRRASFLVCCRQVGQCDGRAPADRTSSSACRLAVQTPSTASSRPDLTAFTNSV